MRKAEYTRIYDAGMFAPGAIRVHLTQATVEIEAARAPVFLFLRVIKEGFPVDVREASWTEFRRVSAKKVAMYSTAPIENGLALERGEVVGVSAEKAGWLRASFVTEKD